MKDLRRRRIDVGLFEFLVLVRGNAGLDPADVEKHAATFPEHSAVNIVWPHSDPCPALESEPERTFARDQLFGRIDIFAAVREADIPADINLNAVDVGVHVLGDDRPPGNGKHLHLELVFAVQQDRGHVLDPRYRSMERHGSNHRHFLQE